MHASKRQVLWRLIELAVPFKWGMALAALLGVLTIVSNVGLMATSAWVISMAAISDTVAVFGVSIVGVRFFGISRGVFRYLERLSSHDVTFKLLQTLRVWFYQAVEPLAPAGLSHHRSGDLLTRVVSDIEALQEFYIRVIAPTMVAIIAVLFMSIFTAAYHPVITLTLLGFFALAGIVLPWIVLKLTQRAGPQFVQARADLNSTLVDSIQGLPELLVYNAEARQQAHTSRLSERYDDAQMQFVRVEGLQLALGSLIASLAMWTVLIVAFPFVQRVNLATLALGALASFEAVLPLSVMVRYLSTTSEAASRLFDLADQDAQLQEPEIQIRKPALGSFSLDIQRLSFRYAPEEPLVLQDVTLRIEQGQKIALVGASGAGKSTLLRLLLRFWYVEANMILLNDADMTTLPDTVTRQQFSVVTQRTHLFNDSLRGNLLIARPSATDAELWRVLHQAQLAEFVDSLPEGLETSVGEQGVLLSGGERQRLALARGLLKDAPCLLLDEPTANLDAITERQLMQVIMASAVQRSVLMITHRLVHLEAFDQIYVLDAGRIKEQGTHASLMEQAGLYTQMYRQQAGYLQQAVVKPTQARELLPS